jgi:hypothetical protein
MEEPMIRKFDVIVVGLSFACALAVSGKALGAVEAGARLASQHSSWVGGKSNLDSLLTGLRNGSSVTLVTTGNNTRSLAGFTPQARMSDEEIATALAEARGTLRSLGIRQPTADQIQAALIGGELILADGRTRLVQGSVPLLQEPVVSPVATR